MCLTEKTYDIFKHYQYLCKIGVKTIPKQLEYFDANKDILQKTEGQYLGMMDKFKDIYDFCNKGIKNKIDDIEFDDDFNTNMDSLEFNINILNDMHQLNLDKVEYHSLN